MRKLFILKTIIDVLWFFSVITIPIIVFAIPTLFFLEESLESVSNFKIFGNKLPNKNDVFIKIYTVSILISYLLLIYALYKFRKIMGQFLRTKIFSNSVINNFKAIGNTLIISGLLVMTSTFIYKIYAKSTLEIELGFSTNIIIICFGLFSLVLSEIFKISKNLKQENELTI